MVKGIVNEYNRHRLTYPSGYTVQASQTNPFLSMTPETGTAFMPPAEHGQDLSSSTLTTRMGNQGNQSDSYSDPDEPCLGDVFKNERGKPDHKALAIHYKAM